MPNPEPRIAVIPGDGIGQEVIDEGVRVLEAAASRFDLSITWESFAWGCEEYRRTGRMMPEDGIAQLRDFDSIYLGAVGDPSVPDRVSLWGLLIPIRRDFDQYVSLRPCRLFAGVESPLRNVTDEGIDFWIVRENTEGEYSELGGKMFADTDRELVCQQSIFSRHGVDRIINYAFQLAEARPKHHVTSATKSNGIVHTMPYWDERFWQAAVDFPKVTADQFHIDILAANFVRDPSFFDVVVASNLFGDILSDLGAAITGSIGLAPSASLNPDGKFPSMFEPVHGSAPDIVGMNVANPIAAIWAGALMLENLGHQRAAEAIIAAMEQVLSSGGPRTPDLGGSAATSEVGKAIAECIS
jgi:tartrate dehydrogenase/decarboxylase/D-malate dehydrogenase